MEKETKTSELTKAEDKDSIQDEDGVIVAAFKWLLGYNFHQMGTKKDF